MFFERFKETVFVKTGNDLKRKLVVLEELRKQYPDHKQLNDEYAMVKAGLKGEDEIAYELKDADIGMYVLRDITIQIDDSKAQIDYIIITPAHTYFVECKNLIGNIEVDEKGEFIREYFDQETQAKIRKSIYSPVRQSEKHKEIFKKIWEKNHNRLFTNLFEKMFDDYYKTLVVMAKSDGILKISKAPEDIKNIVIRSDNLVEYLKKDIAATKKNDLVPPKQMKEYAEGFLMRTIEKKVDYKAEYLEKFGLVEESKNTSLVDKEILRNKLIEFRKNKAKERKIPAYYIFTNKELENLLTYMPKSIEDMKKTGILAKTKIEFHGREILDIMGE